MLFNNLCTTWSTRQPLRLLAHLLKDHKELSAQLRSLHATKYTERLMFQIRKTAMCSAWSESHNPGLFLEKAEVPID